MVCRGLKKKEDLTLDEPSSLAPRDRQFDQQLVFNVADGGIVNVVGHGDVRHQVGKKMKNKGGIQAGGKMGDLTGNAFDKSVAASHADVDTTSADGVKVTAPADAEAHNVTRVEGILNRRNAIIVAVIAGLLALGGIVWQQVNAKSASATEISETETK